MTARLNLSQVKYPLTVRLLFNTFKDEFLALVEKNLLLIRETLIIAVAGVLVAILALFISCS